VKAITQHKKVEISLEAELAKILDPTGTKLNLRVQEAVVLALFQEDVISAGKAAEILRISKDSFRSLLLERRIPYIRQSLEEITRDAEVATSARSR
jgi:predicted HTH domain antitoxin